MKSLKVLFAFLLILSAVACQPQDEDLTGGDPLEASYQKIDRGEYDQAIAALEELSLKDPRPQVKEALASAYAARAGVRVENYWGAVVGFEAPLLQKKSSRGSDGKISRFLAQLEGHRDLSGKDELSKLADLFADLAEWKARIDSLPVVSPEAQSDLLEALLILEDHETPGGRLYRALLGLILLKSEITDGFVKWDKTEVRLKSLIKSGKPSKNPKDILCSIDFRSFGAWAQIIIQRLGEVGGDVAIAYPSKREAIENALEESERVTGTFVGMGAMACR